MRKSRKIRGGRSRRSLRGGGNFTWVGNFGLNAPPGDTGFNWSGAPHELERPHVGGKRKTKRSRRRQPKRSRRRKSRFTISQHRVNSRRGR
jgi:hypothetical protein